jgi:hypothetical protein
MDEKDQGTCELIIYCYKCEAKFQLNPDMIAVALATNANIWEIYNYILTIPCKECESKLKSNDQNG